MKRTPMKLKRVKNAVMLCAGLCLLFIFVLFAIAPEAFAPYDPKESFEAFEGCSGAHILGTNNLGYDIFSELVYATRNTLVVGLAAAAISLCIGVFVGVLAGYAGGFLGEALNGIINFFLLVPMLPLAIVLAAYFGTGQTNIIVTIALLGWCGTARAVKAKTEAVKAMPFITAMKGLGYSRLRIVLRHILPNISDVALARYITSVASCILLEATLSFLGLGGGATVTWGVMINYAYKFGGLSRGAYNWLLAPGFCIMLLELAFYFVNRFFENRAATVRGGGDLE